MGASSLQVAGAEQDMATAPGLRGVPGGFGCGCGEPTRRVGFGDGCAQACEESGRCWPRGGGGDANPDPSIVARGWQELFIPD